MRLTPATVEEAPVLAAVHASAFQKPWNAEAFAVLLRGPGVFAWLACEETQPVGLILMRAIADEAEVLTLAVSADHRRRGVARRLLAQGLDGARAAGAERVFLEVADDNGAAIALYAQAGFVKVGRRKAYYARVAGPAADALVMQSRLTRSGA